MLVRLPVLRAAWRVAVLSLLGLSAWGPTANAVVLISQDKALAGNVTPGDQPGFPVSITGPGSYRLISNLNVGINPNRSAIVIASADVTLDLDGYRINGPTRCSGTPLACSPAGNGRGISAIGRRNVHIFNGSIVGMGLVGVITGPEGRIEQLAARSNGAVGIYAGESSTVTHSTASLNGQTGIVALSGGSISSSTATLNGQTGILAQAGTITACAASANGGRGISVGTGGTIVAGAATGNKDFGVSAEEGSVVFATASSANRSGILARSGSTVAVSAATSSTGSVDSGDGILTEDGVTVFGNATAANGRRGISAENQSTVFANTAYENKAEGINGNAGVVIANTAGSNVGFGFTGGSGLAINAFTLNNGTPVATQQRSGGWQLVPSMCFGENCP